MNIKKSSLKIMCMTLACTTILSGLLAVNASSTIVTETPMSENSGGGGGEQSNWIADEGSLESIEVTYNQSASYFVTIPKTIALDKNKQAVYSVKVSGHIDTNQRVHVVPVDSISDTENIDFYMKEINSKKEDVIATVIQNKEYWNSEEVANAYEETSNSVSAPDLTAGAWKGTFQVAINLETDVGHTHNYVDGVCTGCEEKDPNAPHEHNYIDGKCECGAVDPNHEHNYEDGECTICGKEVDPYEIAPASAYSKWNYTLDNTNNIITLNYYIGSETNVIVYGNYVIGGKTYKTQIASNNGIQTTKYMFNGYSQSNCQNIKSIIFSKSIDTSNVTNMSWMFCYCLKLTSLDLSSLDTSNVVDMSGMFNGCNALTSLNVSNFNTSNVTNMRTMFSGCHLTSIDLSSFDTSKVTDMDWMFYSCTLTAIDLSSWDTSNVIDMNGMFYLCTNLESLTFGDNWDTSNVTNMMQMFQHCRSLTSLDTSSFNTNNVTNMAYMFDNCQKLTSLDVSSFNTSNVTDMNHMFNVCSTLTSLDLSSFETSNVAKMTSMFTDCSNLKLIYVTNGKWNTSLATTTDMFKNCGTNTVTYK